MTTLGKLTRITNLRETWPDEARDFTPWLARAENLAVLSEHLGLGAEGLEKEAVEKFVGPYKADILCRDTTTGNWVLIENQLERTDHSHLGQILVYAAGLDCKTVIWISRMVTPEHKVAVEWLNRLASDGTSFYALEIELWRIGESAIAPSFNTVVRPSESARQAENAKTGIVVGDGLTLSQQELFEYWQGFEALLAKRQSNVRPVSPLPQNWLTHSIGKSGVNLNTLVNRKHNWVRVGLYLQGAKAHGYFMQLREAKLQLEAQLGYALEWSDSADIERQIYVTLTYPNVSDRQTWPVQHEWLANQIDSLHRVFHDTVRGLK
jgi:hypothetical protein